MVIIMRLWHQYLIEYLPDKQLLGQHRELCALRGLGFGKKHRIVNYVFDYPYYCLYKFHLIVIDEMVRRNFKVDELWFDSRYRGKKIGYDNSTFTKKILVNTIIYKEHSIEYLVECLKNLNNKNIYLSIPQKGKFYDLIQKNNLLKYVSIIE